MLLLFDASIVTRIAIIIAGLSLLLVAPVTALAEIHVEWGYTIPDPPPNLTGYRLYQNGTQAHEWLDPLLTEGDAPITPDIGDVFTLTAIFDDASESPHSPEYTWTAYTTIMFFRIVWMRIDNKHLKLNVNNKPVFVRP